MLDARNMAAALTLLLTAGAAPTADVTLQQVVSREHPAFKAAVARLTVGRDGKVYLSSEADNVGYVLRVNRDGSGRYGGTAVYALGNATANADGVIATANAHFAHKVTLYDAALRPTGAVDEFLVNDAVGWSGPPHVEAGASGDFYGLDHHRDRVVRLSPQGKLLKAYHYTADRKQPGGLPWDFRVCEKTEAFYLVGMGGPIRCVGFDGKERWAVNAGVGAGHPTPSGGFDVDDAGTLYVLGPRESVVRTYGSDGKPAGEIKLQKAAPEPAQADAIVTALRVHGGDLVVRHRHSSELFQVYDRATGKLKNAVQAAHERLTVTFPRRTWTAGEGLPFRVELTGARGAPVWRVWLRSLDEVDYRELPLRDGRIEVPADLCGVYVVKVTPELRPLSAAAPEYHVRTWVEVRPAGVKGTLSVWTAPRRSRFARGEPILVRVQARGGEGRMDVEVRLVEDSDKPRVVVAGRVQVTPDEEPAALTVPGSLTRTLRPGRYVLTAKGSGLATASQPLVIGPAAGEAPRFHYIAYGDYSTYYPQAGPFELPDAVAVHADRAARLGANLFVERLGIPMHHAAVDTAYARGELAGVLAHLEKSRGGAAPTKYAPPPLIGPTLSAYAAAGIEEMAILTANDAGLPLGTGFDGRKAEQMVADLTRVTEAAAPFPSFRGWVWGSNWWNFGMRGSAAARDPDQKAAYEAALQEARKTGRWSPVLEEVANRRLTLPTEAQALFNKALAPLAEKHGRKLVTASAGPYRNVESYPPLSLSNVDEIDLQAQWEQIAVPYHAPHGVDFYRRPGKRAWLHPEVWNDAGTGEQVLPTLLQGIMRGADGVGWSGVVPPWGRQPPDPRHGHAGQVSVYRALGETLRAYGPWLATLENADRVAIAVSGRPLRIDDWPNVMGTHFARLFEAYVACLHARHPASLVFAEDVKPDTFKRYRAVLVIGQTVEMEPALADALKAAQQEGVKVFHDGTCRPELVQSYTPLGVAFNRFEKDRHPASDDSAYQRFPAYVRETAPVLAKALDAVAPPVAGCDRPEVLMSERKSGAGRYLFVVNNTTPDLAPGHIWRTTLLSASRVPVEARVKLTGDAPAVYDMFAGRRVEPKDGAVTADLRTLPARLYAVLPQPIKGISLVSERKTDAGEMVAWTVRVLGADGKPIEAGIPVHVRLIDAGSDVVEETHTATADGGSVSGRFVIPQNVRGEELTLEATELLSGTFTSARAAVKPSTGPAILDEKGQSARRRLATSFQELRAEGQGRKAWRPAAERFGPHLRDLAVTGDGSQVVVSAFNWDTNLYGLDAATGKVAYRRRLEQYFAFDPRPLPDGVAVQGFAFTAAEGYHLHLVAEDGKSERRFALYGLPTRLPHRFVPAILGDRINNFALAPDGSWVAAAGDLGLAVWARDGKLRWSQDWWKERRRTALLHALDGKTLLTVEDVTATAYSAADGKELWRHALAPTGTVKQVRSTPDGRTVALLATTDGGRVFFLRDGKPGEPLAAIGDDMALSPDGAHVALVAGIQLKLCAAGGGLRWTLPGDDGLHAPRFSPDGRRVFVGSELGTGYVVSLDGEVALERDFGALPVAAWTPDGDLVVATWMGAVERLCPDYRARWSARLHPAAVELTDAKLLARDDSPTARPPRWGNAEPEGAPVPPNLLTEKNVIIDFRTEASHVRLVRPYAALVDGKPEPPSEPWLAWGDVGWFAERRNTTHTIELDTFTRRLRVRAVTLTEDPAHPESWVRDARLEAWDPTAERWVQAGALLSDQATHTHVLPRPVEASRWRIVPASLVGNLRLAEIALHGEDAGPAHPDVAAKKPVAVLFDEGDDLKAAGLVAPHFGLSFVFGDAHSGGRAIRQEADRSAAAPYRPPFGHVLPGWDFEVVEKPGPGQYRYLQFAAKALAPETTGWTLRLDGEGYGNAVSCYAGTYQKEADAKGHPVADAPAAQWRVYRVDLWDVLKRPVRIRGLRLATRGGPAAFDQVLLGRSERDLPPVR